MPIVLLRVDERLIHGQVVVGWANSLKASRVAVLDDELAASPWEQELYTLGLPDDLDAEYAALADAGEALDRWRRDADRTIVLLRDIGALEAIADSVAAADGEVNLGGVHHSPGKTEVLPYLFLDAEDRASLRRLSGSGIGISACDVPGARRVGVAELLAE